MDSSDVLSFMIIIMSMIYRVLSLTSRVLQITYWQQCSWGLSLCQSPGGESWWRCGRAEQWNSSVGWSTLLSQTTPCFLPLHQPSGSAGNYPEECVQVRKVGREVMGRVIAYYYQSQRNLTNPSLYKTATSLAPIDLVPSLADQLPRLHSKRLIVKVMHDLCQNDCFRKHLLQQPLSE